MSYFTSNNKQVYYEIHGEGKPLVILNGIMMSTVSWQAFLKSFTNNQIILVDFFDQGQSDKCDGESYNLDLQASLVNDLITHLEFDRVNILGISYGAQVALNFTVKYQERIERLMIFNAGSYTSPWLKDIGIGWKLIAQSKDSDAFIKATIPIIYSPDFYSTNIDWMKNREEILKSVFTPTFLDAMIRLIDSAEEFDVRDKLNTIKVPTLVVGAENDYLTPLQEQRCLNDQIENSNLAIIPNCGHASMYENPTLFISLVNGFINSSSFIKII